MPLNDIQAKTLIKHSRKHALHVSGKSGALRLQQPAVAGAARAELGCDKPITRTDGGKNQRREVGGAGGSIARVTSQMLITRPRGRARLVVSAVPSGGR